MRTIDQMQRSVHLPDWPPRRIVSLVPSQTELLADFGLDNQVVGITKFCIHPSDWFRNKKRVGGTKTINLEKIAALRPDLIIGNKEENQQEQIEALAQNFPVWMSDIQNLAAALEMIEALGRITDRLEPAIALVSDIKAGFEGLNLVKKTAPMTVAYLIWRKPYMAAGGDTFLHDMLEHAGFHNIFGDRPRYPEITHADLAAAQPDVVFLSSEPYPFAEKHLVELKNICPFAKIMLVDGEIFSWYGSRLKLAPAYFQQLHQWLQFGVENVP